MISMSFMCEENGLKYIIRKPTNYGNDALVEVNRFLVSSALMLELIQWFLREIDI